MEIKILNLLPDPISKTTKDMEHGEFAVITGNGSGGSRHAIGKICFKHDKTIYLLDDVYPNIDTLSETYSVRILDKTNKLTITIE